MATSTKPILFDKNLLKTEEFRSYIYSINFGGKKVSDLSAEGYLHAITPYVDAIEPELLEMREFEASGGRKGFHVVVRTTLFLKYGENDNVSRALRVAALADGTSFEAKDPAALIRIVETRALKRAIGRALDLGKKDINQMLNERGDAPEEDEVGTPLEKEYNPSPLHDALRASRDKVAKAMEQRKAATAAAAQDAKPSGTGEGVDW